MNRSTKSHKLLQHEEAISYSNLAKGNKTQDVEIKQLKLPPKMRKSKERFSSLSRKIYIVTDQDDQIAQSMPTAKHTFLSQQHSKNDELNFSGFYTPRRDDKQRGIRKQNFDVGPDVTSQVNNLNVSSKSSRFYYKEEQYELLEKEQEQKVVKTEENKKLAKNNREKEGQNNKQGPKNNGKQGGKQASQLGDQTPQSNPTMLNSYLQKINRHDTPQILVQQGKQQQSSPFAKKSPGQTQVFTPHQNQIDQFTSNPSDPNNPNHPHSKLSYKPYHPHLHPHSQAHSSSPLHESHQKLFSKCYKQTYSHLKLMLKQIHQSQQNIHILHKQITDTVYEVIKQRADALREEMNFLVNEICDQWVKDQWEFVMKNQMMFIDDILEIQQQLTEREQEVHELIHRLAQENQKSMSQRDQSILVTFNKHLVNSSLARNQTSWKKVTTDLLMFNYENNITEIQSLIEKISFSSYEKCNKAIDALPSSQMFSQNTHSETLNPEAKKWFRNAVLDFMNNGAHKIGEKESPSKAKRESPRKKLHLGKTYFLSA